MQPPERQPWAERHYSVKEVAKMWRLGFNTVVRLFRDEPGVVKLCPPHKKGKRTRVTLRIPESVLIRVYKRCIVKKVG